ncbi:MAG: endonuclease domain-containing protein [Firmicutes bacterium]|nr:endonuclease domain-containing protein [Bacillota bacterium]
MEKYTSYSKDPVGNAKSLRKNMTPQEKHLWYDYLRHYPVKFYRQRPVGGYITDFYCSKAGLVIEPDGSQHFTVEGLKYDGIRTEVLEKYSLTVLRFTNLQVDREFETVCLQIDDTVKRLMESK